jgi:hypothetical protein
VLLHFVREVNQQRTHRQHECCESKEDHTSHGSVRKRVTTARQMQPAL